MCDSSFQSDDSGDSEAFVVVDRGGGPNSPIGGLDDTIDSTLFTVHSKVTYKLYQMFQGIIKPKCPVSFITDT